MRTSLLLIAATVFSGVAFSAPQCGAGGTTNLNPLGSYQGLVTGTNLVGCLTAADSPAGLIGSGAFTDFSISWSIVQSGSNFLYDYTFYDSGTGNGLRTISHLILGISSSCTEVSQSATPNSCIWALSDAPASGDPTTYTSSDPSNDGLPGNLYGFKISGQTQTSQSFTFTSNRAPIWQNVYVKDGGTTNFAYNKGFTSTDASSYFIAAPDTSVVPEPGYYAVLALGMLGLVGVARKRQQKSA